MITEEPPAEAVAISADGPTADRRAVARRATFDFIPGQGQPRGAAAWAPIWRTGTGIESSRRRRSGRHRRDA